MISAEFDAYRCRSELASPARHPSPTPAAPNAPRWPTARTLTIQLLGTSDKEMDAVTF